MKRIALALAALLSIAAAANQDKKKAFTNPAEAGPDFKIQGEYSGEIPGHGKMGGQVIARGDGKFDLVFYVGGLPGDGWDGNTRLRAKAETKDGKTVIQGGKWQGDVDGVTITGKMSDGTPALLKKVIRKSRTLGAKPPKGATVLFDGTSADAWKNGKIVEGNLLQMGTTSKEKFGNVKVHIEFRLCFQPFARGQGRSNSGVYFAGRHEVQVLDSFGLEGKNNECGGLYSVKDPDLNMCYPPLSWQTYDVEYRLATAERGATITVFHNGVKVHDNVEIRKKGTTAAPNKGGTDTPGPIFLQNHGNPLVYRNIWVVPLND